MVLSVTRTSRRRSSERAAAFLLLQLPLLVASFSCIHDEVVRASKPAQNGVLAYPDADTTIPFSPASSSSSTRRALSSLGATTTSPLRIVPVYIGLESEPNMTAELIAFVRDTLVPAAAAKWKTLLATIPVSGPLYAHRSCNSYWTSSQPYKCARFADSTACGGGGGGSTSDIAISFNSTFLGTDVNYTSGGAPVTQPAGSGLPDADFGLFVTARQTTSCGSGGSGTLAYALTCQRDQFDRPSWGRANFCPLNLDASPSAWHSQLSTAVHELGHALGFSSSSWALWRDTDANRTALTPRDTRYPSQPVASNVISYTCSGGNYAAYMPANNSLTYVSERGMSCSFPSGSYPPSVATSDCVAKFVGPKTLNVSRTFFGCPTLNGAELENQLTSACDVLGSHWEQRIMQTELMGSFSMHDSKVSPLTLAVFEDSGWYTANYSAADEYRQGQDFGYKQGCEFAAGRCLNITTGIGTGSPPHFYSVVRSPSDASAVCTIDRLAVGYTSIGNYGSSLPPQYQYFADTTEGGTGPDVFDYCPVVSGYSNRLCADAGDAYANAFIFGEYFGNNASCFASNLRRNGYVTSGNGAGCYSSRCNATRALFVGIDGKEYQCTAKGNTITPSGYTGSLTCPDPIITCSPGERYDPNADASATGDAGASSSSTPAPSPTATSSGISSATRSGTTSATASATTSKSGSSSPMPTRSASGTVTRSASSSATASETVTPASSMSGSSTASSTASKSASTSAKASALGSATTTSTASSTSSYSPSPSSHASTSSTASGTASPTHYLGPSSAATVSATSSSTASGTATSTSSASESAAPTLTTGSSASSSPSEAATPTPSTSPTPTISLTPMASTSPLDTSTGNNSSSSNTTTETTPTPSASSSTSVTPSPQQSSGNNNNNTNATEGTATPSPSASTSPLVSASASAATTPTDTNSTGEPSPSPSSTAASSPSPASAQETPTPSASSSSSPAAAESPSPSPSPSPPLPSGERSPSSSATSSATASSSASYSTTPSLTSTPSATPTPAPAFVAVDPPRHPSAVAAGEPLVLKSPQEGVMVSAMFAGGAWLSASLNGGTASSVSSSFFIALAATAVQGTSLSSASSSLPPSPFRGDASINFTVTLPVVEVSAGIYRIEFTWPLTFDALSSLRASALAAAGVNVSSSTTTDFAVQVALTVLPSALVGTAGADAVSSSVSLMDASAGIVRISQPLDGAVISLGYFFSVAWSVEGNQRSFPALSLVRIELVIPPTSSSSLPMVAAVLAENVTLNGGGGGGNATITLASSMFVACSDEVSQTYLIRLVVTSPPSGSNATGSDGTTIVQGGRVTLADDTLSGSLLLSTATISTDFSVYGTCEDITVTFPALLESSEAVARLRRALGSSTPLSALRTTLYLQPDGTTDFAQELYSWSSLSSMSAGGAVKVPYGCCADASLIPRSLVRILDSGSSSSTYSATCAGLHRIFLRVEPASSFVNVAGACASPGHADIFSAASSSSSSSSSSLFFAPEKGPSVVITSPSAGSLSPIVSAATPLASVSWAILPGTGRWRNVTMLTAMATEAASQTPNATVSIMALRRAASNGVDTEAEEIVAAGSLVRRVAVVSQPPTAATGVRMSLSSPWSPSSQQWADAAALSDGSQSSWSRTLRVCITITTTAATAQRICGAGGPFILGGNASIRIVGVKEEGVGAAATNLSSLTEWEAGSSLRVSWSTTPGADGREAGRTNATRFSISLVLRRTLERILLATGVSWNASTSAFSNTSSILVRIPLAVPLRSGAAWDIEVESEGLLAGSTRRAASLVEAVAAGVVAKRIVSRRFSLTISPLVVDLGAPMRITWAGLEAWTRKDPNATLDFDLYAIAPQTSSSISSSSTTVSLTLVGRVASAVNPFATTSSFSVTWPSRAFPGAYIVRATSRGCPTLFTDSASLIVRSPGGAAAAASVTIAKPTEGAAGSVLSLTAGSILPLWYSTSFVPSWACVRITLLPLASASVVGAAVGGSTLLLADCSPNTGTFSWSIPFTATTTTASPALLPWNSSSLWRVRVCARSIPSNATLSNFNSTTAATTEVLACADTRVLRVVSPPRVISVTSPALGSSWKAGQTIPIRWSSSGFATANAFVRIDVVSPRYWAKGGDVLLASLSQRIPAATGAANWTLPSVLSAWGPAYVVVTLENGGLWGRSEVVEVRPLQLPSLPELQATMCVGNVSVTSPALPSALCAKTSAECWAVGGTWSIGSRASLQFVGGSMSTDLSLDTQARLAILLGAFDAAGLSLCVGGSASAGASAGAGANDGGVEYGPFDIPGIASTIAGLFSSTFLPPRAQLILRPGRLLEQPASFSSSPSTVNGSGAVLLSFTLKGDVSASDVASTLAQSAGDNVSPSNVSVQLRAAMLAAASGGAGGAGGTAAGVSGRLLLQQRETSLLPLPLHFARKLQSSSSPASSEDGELFFDAQILVDASGGPEVAAALRASLLPSLAATLALADGSDSVSLSNLAIISPSEMSSLDVSASTDFAESSTSSPTPVDGIAGAAVSRPLLGTTSADLRVSSASDGSAQWESSTAIERAAVFPSTSGSGSGGGAADDSASSFSTAAAIGVAVGLVVGLGLAAAGAFLVVRRRRTGAGNHQPKLSSFALRSSKRSVLSSASPLPLNHHAGGDGGDGMSWVGKSSALGAAASARRAGGGGKPIPGVPLPEQFVRRDEERRRKEQQAMAVPAVTTPSTTPSLTNQSGQRARVSTVLASAVGGGSRNNDDSINPALRGAEIALPVSTPTSSRGTWGASAAKSNVRNLVPMPVVAASASGQPHLRMRGQQSQQHLSEMDIAMGPPVVHHAEPAPTAATTRTRFSVAPKGLTANAAVTSSRFGFGPQSAGGGR